MKSNIGFKMSRLNLVMKPFHVPALQESKILRCLLRFAALEAKYPVSAQA